MIVLKKLPNGYSIKVLEETDIDLKLKTRELYESCFDTGKKDYIDYYYSEIIKRNLIFVCFDEDKIISMIHLNPYIYNICGNIDKVYYIIAVATKTEYRNKGIMNNLLECAMEYLKKNNVPFCFLMADNEKLYKTYERHGFYVLCNFTYDKFTKDEFDVHPIRSYEFDKMMENEQKFLDIESDEYKEFLKKQKICVRILDDKKMGCIKSIEEFRKKRCLFCQEA